MRRLNVRFSQIEECIRTSMFALDVLPVNPPLKRGEVLLLQLVKADAKDQGVLGKRIQFALIFDRKQPDSTGAISREHWPDAGKTWDHILVCSETIACIPFSLEDLGLSKDYGSQTNAMYILPEDEARILPYLQGAAGALTLPELSSVEDLLATIRNHDRIAMSESQRRVQVRDHERRLPDPWLGNALKQFYDHQCQICLHDFKPRYSVPFADTRFLKSMAKGGLPVSRNLVVLCPNHGAIIAETQASYDAGGMAFRYPNGLVEKLRLRDHLFN